jgi:hypothetical protein
MSKKAVLIGINYIRTGIELYGCINDMLQVQNVLIYVYGYKPENIVFLRDDDPSNMPTRNNIIGKLKDLVASKPSEYMICYSGHGTNYKDMNSDEKDGIDEYIVPCDVRSAGCIVDDELNIVLRGLFKTPGLALFDCCRSGTVLDLQYEGVSSELSTERGLICISGCMDSELASETVDAVTQLPQGAMTSAFLKVLREKGYNIPINTIWNELLKVLKEQGFSQRPYLTSSVPVNVSTPYPIVSIVDIISNDYLKRSITLQNLIKNLQGQVVNANNVIKRLTTQIMGLQRVISQQQNELAKRRRL